MRNLANFLLFQAGWFACVVGAAEGRIWLGPLCVLGIVTLHLFVIAAPQARRYELAYLLGVGLLGLLADSGLGLLGATHYPSSEAAWPGALAPPWITALWVLFATLPHHSLRWLGGNPRLAALLGALGGPLSYAGGARLGAVAVAEPPLLTYGLLALEYALVTPLLLHFVRQRGK